MEGRSKRTGLHRLGQFCQHKGCTRLERERKFDKSLGAYVPR